jgi:integrase/recombinase XerC
MPHYPKPFFRSDRGLWYVQINGRQLNLGGDQDAAFRKYHELMQQPAEIRTELVVGVIEGFLDWCQRRRSARTYAGHKWHLQRFLNSLPNADRLTVDQLKPFHVLNWVDAHPSWGKTYRRNAIGSVQRAFRWALQVGHIEKSPVANIAKPSAERREQLISEAEYRRILAFARDECFRDLLIFSWETGARPQETRIVEAHHFNPEQRRIEIPPGEAKGGKRPRVILLTEAALAVVRRRVKIHPRGPIFRNHCGRTWKQSAINCRLGRMKKKLGVKYALYSFRHSFATRLLTAGADSLSVSALLGHADGTMLARVYSHLDKNLDFLHGVLTSKSGG